MTSKIKLQLLLTKQGAQPGQTSDLLARLKDLGLKVTGQGAVTMSAEVAEEDFSRVFGGKAPEVKSGFGPLSSDSLLVPDDMKDLISDITLAPRHEPMK